MEEGGIELAAEEEAAFFVPAEGRQRMARGEWRMGGVQTPVGGEPFLGSRLSVTAR
jgi:hypothetical protein